MTVRDLIQELEDMPKEATVLLDHRTTVVNKETTKEVWSELSTVVYVGEDVDFDLEDVSTDGDWLDEMDNPPNEFVVLQ